MKAKIKMKQEKRIVVLKDLWMLCLLLNETIFQWRFVGDEFYFIVE